MKVVCINNYEYYRLDRIDLNNVLLNKELDITTNKIYSIISENDHSYKVINDVGMMVSYMKERFKSLKEVREEKLNKIFEK